MTASIATLPELLSPAGDWDCLRAAAANGADAVYFGLPSFSARHRATNFTIEELPAVMQFLHDRNVRGYVAFNTLIFSDELPDAARAIAAAVAAGIDALIVQDMGLVRLLRQLAPTLPIHASTQMTLTEPAGIAFVRALGVERVILARELSLQDIGRIRAASDMPLEVFVHGALCIAYSGQCLTSEALGGRSANRGQCAQACRMPYELIVDGQRRDLGDQAYLLSPLDLASHEVIDELIHLGVCSLKIEGRLKTPHYVAATTQTYRAAIEAAGRQQRFELSRQGQLDLTQTFSRGFSTGFLRGVDHQQLVPGLFPKSRGVRVGTVIGVSRRGVLVQLDADHAADILKPGDGVCFDEGRPEQQELGGRLFAVKVQGNGSKPSPDLSQRERGLSISKPSPGLSQGERSLPSFKPSPDLSQRERGLSISKPSPGLSQGERGLNGGVTSSAPRLELVLSEEFDNSNIKPGSLVWRTDDPALRKRLEASFTRDLPHHRQALRAKLSGALGGPVELRLHDAAGREARVQWDGPLELARSQPLSHEQIGEQLGRLGDTPFELTGLEIDLPTGAMTPKSVLNDLRRRAVAELLQSSADALRTRPVHVDALEKLRGQVAERPHSPRTESPQLYVLARTLEQLEAVLAWRGAGPIARPAMVYCDFEDVRRYREAVDLARAAAMPIGLATLRIIKPGEEGLLAQIARCGADAALVRNLAGISFFREHAPETRLIGDFSLNVANELAADLFASQGLERLTPSYDLNWEQLTAMLGRIDPGLFEAVVHQHMPMFHMEHCVFAAVLSDGKDWRDCGRPCDHHRVELRDRVGSSFPLVADTGCRNTVFNSVAQSAAEYIARMLTHGLRHFRVELLRESATESVALVERYARLLAGLEVGRDTWRQLQVLNQLGVTRGTLQMS